MRTSFAPGTTQRIKRISMCWLEHDQSASPMWQGAASEDAASSPSSRYSPDSSSGFCLVPSAGSASASALYVSNCLIGPEAIDLQRRFMVTRPIAFTLATAEHNQLRDAMRTDVSDGNGLCVHSLSLRQENGPQREVPSRASVAQGDSLLAICVSIGPSAMSKDNGLLNFCD
jgi:hypothetical protein